MFIFLVCLLILVKVITSRMFRDGAEVRLFDNHGTEILDDDDFPILGFMGRNDEWLQIDSDDPFIDLDNHSSIFGDDAFDHSFPEINPASGLPMTGGCFDVGGNPYGFHD
jgi:hypothetical protein